MATGVSGKKGSDEHECISLKSSAEQTHDGDVYQVSSGLFCFARTYLLLQDVSEEAKLKPFLNMRDCILDCIDALESDATVGEPCDCGRGARLYRCEDCGRVRLMCRECIVVTHELCPFHWAEEWTGSFFKRVDLSEVGLKVFLGHGGKACPHAQQDGSRMHITDVNGMHTCLVVFCACVNRHGGLQQLLRHSLFPAGTKKTEAAFTFRVLKDFRILANTAKTSVHDYVRAIRRKTNNYAPGTVKVHLLVISSSDLD